MRWKGHVCLWGQHITRKALICNQANPPWARALQRVSELALELMHRLQLDVALDHLLFLQLHCISLEDINDADPILYSTNKEVLEMDLVFFGQEASGLLSFIQEIERFVPQW